MAHETIFPLAGTTHETVFPLGWTMSNPSAHETVFPLGVASGETPSGIPTYYTVSGAGNTLVNGTYSYGGLAAYHHYYINPNGYLMGFFVSVWSIALGGGHEATQYTVTAGVEVVPPESGWTVYSGTPPAPTVIAGPPA